MPQLNTRLYKKRGLTLVLILASIPLFVSGQDRYTLSGTVHDAYGHPLNGATVNLAGTSNVCHTHRDGAYLFQSLQPGRYLISAHFIGYTSQTDTVELTGDTHLNILLKTRSQELNPLVVNGSQSSKPVLESTLSVQTVAQDYLQENAAGSLMQTLSRLPGVSSIDIGSAQSKPVIRGLGFNRVVVTENNIIHEGQEWGSDHGLEIDPFTVDRVTVLKGPASLLYGSNAIGGVIHLENRQLPGEKLTGSLLLTTRSNNNLYSISTRLEKRIHQWFFRIAGTFSEYGDYKVPADSIEYLSYNIRLKNQQVRNTAGKEHNGYFQMGYTGKNWLSRLTVTDHFSKSGFFANAHGLEIRNSQIRYDQSDRDIDLPSQQVNHLKILSNTVVNIQEYELTADWGFQNNHRKEFSEAVAHGYMPAPSDSLERLYDKSTLSGSIRLRLPVHSRHRIQSGISGAFSRNRIGGWGFILPAYTSATAGIFAHDLFQLTHRFSLEGGLRWDAGQIQTNAYRDWYSTPVEAGKSEQILRSEALDRTFYNLSFGLGSSYKSQTFNANLHLGKSFRMPTAQELANNGINYHMFRYEKGQARLHAEESWQLDAGAAWTDHQWDFECTPFVHYFTNYIYLNPSSDYEEGQQIYYYSESRVFRYGGECSFVFRPSTGIELHMDAEYVASTQLSGTKKGYTLPFSPPFTLYTEWNWHPAASALKDWSFRLGLKYVAAQNEIVPPEKKTPGWQIVDCTVQKKIKIKGETLTARMLVDNLLNSKYYDHTSFYRLIEVPGPGRNVTFSVQCPFTF